MKKSSDLELAYLAGIFDGEGCVRIHKSGKSFVLQVNVGNTSPGIVNCFHKVFGGCVAPLGSPRMPHHKQGYYWKVYSENAYRCLKELLPFLLIKHEEAEVAIKFHENRERCDGWSHRVSEEELCRRETEYLKLRLLKKVEGGT